MSIAPECEYELDDVDCDREATHEVTVGKPGSLTHDRRVLACAEHSEQLAESAGRLIAETVEVLPSTGGAEHAARVPAGYECTRIPNHEGPCALRPLQPVGIATVPTPYRPSKWSSPWILLLGLIGYELWAVATSKAGGPLSHLVWWAYGDRWSARWWLASMSLNGLGVWAAMHFMFEKWEVRELGACVFFGLLLGLVGYLTCWVLDL